VDALSDVLRLVRLKGGVFLHAEFTAPWCILSQVAPEDCGPLLDGVEHILLYHYVVEGRLRAQIPHLEPVDIETGEVVIFPHNHAHLLGSHLDLPPVSAREIVRPSSDGGFLVIRHGGGGEHTRVVCGFLGCDRFDGNLLARILPPVLRFDTRRGSAAAWVKSSLEFAAHEIGARRAGSETMLTKLSELLFVEALRHYVESLPQEQTGWLAGLKDPSCRADWRCCTRMSPAPGPSRSWGARSASPLGAGGALYAADRRAADALPRALAHPARRAPIAQQRYAAGARRRAGRL
jgi:Cupin